MNTQTKETPSKIVKPASLKETRKKLGKTQAQIAEETGMHPCEICRIERRQGGILDNKLELFTKAYGIPLEQLKTLAKVGISSWGQRFSVDNSEDVLPIIKVIVECNMPQLALNDFLRLLHNTSQLRKFTPKLIKEILTCGFK